MCIFSLVSSATTLFCLGMTDLEEYPSNNVSEAVESSAT